MMIKIKKISFVVAVCLISVFCLSESLYAASRRAETEVMVQVFGWKLKNGSNIGNWYKLLGEKTEDLGKMGFTLAWFPPVSRAVDDPGYLPGDYYDLGTPQTPTFYGSGDELKSVLSKMKKAGIKPLADAVLNHRCAGKQDGNGIWNQFVFPSGKAVWDQSAIVRGEFNGTGAPDSGDGFSAAPDLDHSNSKVQNDIVGYLNWLKSVGFNGFRYDFAKGYDPKYVAIFDQKGNSEFSVAELFTDMSYTNSQLEYDQNAHRQKLCDYLDRAGPLTCVFDVTSKGILQEAVKGEYWRLRDQQGKASGLIGWWPLRAVTFTDNHDTGSSQGLWPFPAEKMLQGYAYILTHPGVPCVLWEHIYDWKLRDQIEKLIQIRHKYKIHAGSSLKILKAEQGIYVAVIDDKVAIKIGWQNWTPEESFELQATGDHYAVWGKKTSSR
ncbi:MAG: alpha-amylase [Candidatus Riflebacteria bacterium]|nr:alpha-amylase [Candidatus Riflebacteria bacterium]